MGNSDITVIPFLIFVFKGINNTTKTKQKAENLLKSNGFKYNLQEVWNTKFIGLTQDKKVLSYIHYKDESETHLDINMDQINCVCVLCCGDLNLIIGT